MSEDLAKLDRDGLVYLIGKRMTQAVVLLNHLRDDHQPRESYVAEKLSTYPVLDAFNEGTFESIAVLVESRYGIDIRPSWLKHD